MPDFGDENVTARFADQLMGMSVSKLLSNIGAFHVLISPGGCGEMFNLDGHGYESRLWSDGAVVHFKRNQYSASRAINFPDRYSHINLSWKFDRFQLAVWSDEEVGNDNVCETVLTPERIYVPNTLITWARRKHKLPQQAFESVAEAMGVVIEAIDQIEQRIRDSNLFSLFWDYDRTAKSKSSPKPKREPQSFGGVLGFLQDDSVLKGYTVVPEGEASSGELDAHIIVSLTSGDQGKFAIEAKNAHSPDLEHGLTDQLPEYMRAIDANYGIYLALWYKCEAFDKPEESQTDLGIRLMKMCPLKNIYVDSFDLSLPQSPSQRNFAYE